MRILVAQNDKKTASFIGSGLRQEGHAVDVVCSGNDAADCARTVPYDLLILDLDLSECSGLEVLKTIRKREAYLPVLFLTDNATIDDRVLALDSGADDCLVKPVSVSELSARARALNRRRRIIRETTLRTGDLELNPGTREARRGSRRISLRPKEYSLLEYLMENADHPVTRTNIIEHVWDIHFDSASNVVDVHINSLRTKVDRGERVPLIRTVRGVGYMITDRDCETGAGR